jgi:hypothetical protein
MCPAAAPPSAGFAFVVAMKQPESPLNRFPTSANQALLKPHKDFATSRFNLPQAGRGIFYLAAITAARIGRRRSGDPTSYPSAIS